MICPLCRHHDPEGQEAQLRRCPQDGRIMVRPAALVRGDGDPFLGMLVGHRFAVLEMLGAGSMGTVYRARQEAMARDVALKIVRSERLADKLAKKRFQLEAHAMSLLKSPYTVTVFDFGEIHAEDDEHRYIDGSLYLAMELLDGVSLGRRLKQEQRIPVAEALEITKHALMSLAEAHEKGVIHRDLKPDNLVQIRNPDGSRMCKVLDFGIAKVLTYKEGVDALETQAGTVFGTPRYMSPEQAQGKPLDPRSDLYSLGVILYHMLLGRAPFTDGDAVVVMAHHIKTRPPLPSEIAPDLALPAGLEALLMRILDKRPDSRPQSAAEFIREIEALEGAPSEPVATTALTAVVAEDRLRVSSRWVMAGVGGAAALIVIAGSILATVGSSGEPAAASAGVVSAASDVADRALRRQSASAGASLSAPSAATASAAASDQRTSPARSVKVRLPRPPSTRRGYTKFE